MLYRSVPHAADPDLATAVAQQLRFDYSRSRTAEMEAHASRHEADALLSITDDVLSSQVEIDDISVRGPAFPSPLPRRVMVRVEYRVMKGPRQLAAQRGWLEFDREDGIWRHRRNRHPIFYWLYPL